VVTDPSREPKLSGRTVEVLRVLLTRAGRSGYDWIGPAEVADRLTADLGEPVSAVTTGQVLARIYSFGWAERDRTAWNRWRYRLTDAGADRATDALVSLGAFDRQPGRTYTMAELAKELRREEGPERAEATLAIVRRKLAEQAKQSGTGRRNS